MAGAVRSTVEEIQEIKDRNAMMLQERMVDLKKSMAGLEHQGKAANAYYGPRRDAGVTPSKFVDQSTLKKTQETLGQTDIMDRGPL